MRESIRLGGQLFTLDQLASVIDGDDIGFGRTDSIRKQEDTKLLIDGFIEGNPGKKFTRSEIAGEIGIKNLHKHLKTIEQHPLIKIVHKGKGSICLYQSNALGPQPTPEGIREEQDEWERERDTLGLQARDEFFQREHMPVYRRKKRRKVIRKF